MVDFLSKIKNLHQFLKYYIFFVQFSVESFFLRLWILGQKVWLAISLAIHWKFFLRRNESQYYATLRRASNLAILRNCEEMRKRESEAKKNLLSSILQKASKFAFSLTYWPKSMDLTLISYQYHIKPWFWIIL